MVGIDWEGNSKFDEVTREVMAQRAKKAKEKRNKRRMKRSARG